MRLFQKKKKRKRDKETKEENFLHCLIHCILTFPGGHKNFLKYKDDFFVM